MGYYSDLHITLTKRDYLHMIEKDRENDNICDCFLNEEKAYIKYYEKNNVECVSIRQFNYKYYKEFEEVQTLEKYLRDTKSGYVFLRVGGGWDDMEYRNTAKYKELEQPFKFIESIEHDVIKQIQNTTKEYKQRRKNYTFTDKEDILEFYECNDKIYKYIKEQYNKNIQFKLFLEVDADKKDALSVLYIRTPEEDKYRECRTEYIGIDSAFYFLGYPSEEEFLFEINDCNDNLEEEGEFE